MNKRHVQVAIALPVDGLFTYTVPEDLELVVGHAVLVPFGRRKVSGYVVALGRGDDLPADARLRPVSKLLDPVPAFDEGQLSFLRWAADYYLAGLGEVIATALPASYRRASRRVYLPTESGIEAIAYLSPDGDGDLDEARAAVLREVVARPERTRGGLARALHDEIEADVVGRALDALVRSDLVAAEDRDPPARGGTITTLRLVGAAEAPPSLGARMRAVLARVVEAGGTIDLPRLVQLEGPGARDAAARLERRGLLERDEREDLTASSDADLGGSTDPIQLNADQRAAVDAIVTAATDEQASANTFLLHGVTGSGKTEVYLQAAAAVLGDGADRQVLVLVPEIALTPQLNGRFRARFGTDVAVLHSGLAPGERLREWRRIRAGEARVAVGARSALFAPFSSLGLVIVDEEHDDSYKQDDGVRYHARDLAVVRGRQSGSPVVLGSATPSLESWQNAHDGRYRSLRLPRRATARAVPRVELIDMCGLPTQEPLAPGLADALQQTLHDGGKAIVLYNRRGFAPIVQCPDCGAHYDCPSCGIGLVFHQRRGRLMCHYCGYHRDYQPDCPACGTPFEVMGHGTERIEEVLAERFPGVGIARMDADTTATRGAHHRILDRFRTGDAQLLVGTQLVAKGHDFPDVHLAAVVGVDHLLMLPDFRSAERTWALVTQLAGRAGRGERAGRVLVQTRHPSHFVFRQLAATWSEEGGRGDPDAFYVEEARQRKLLRYPPFARLALVRVEGARREATFGVARELADGLRASADRVSEGVRGAIDVLGPAAAPLSRLVGRWRFQVVLRGRDVPLFRRWLREERGRLRGVPKGGVRVVLDIDPRNLL